MKFSRKPPVSWLRWWPFALVTLAFAFELGRAFLLFRSGPIEMLALSKMITGLAVGRVVWFLARVYLCHLLAGVVLFGVETLFRVRRRLGLYLSLAGYIFLFNVIRNPQIFDDFSWGDSFFVFLTSSLRPEWLLLPGFLFIALLFRQGFPLAGRFVKARISAAAILLFLILWQIRAIERPAFSRPALSTGPVPRAAVILSVDSLRSDATLNPAPGSALSRLLDRAFESRGLITPLAQTHGALTSLLTGFLPVRHGVRHSHSPRTLNSVPPETAAEALRRAGVEVHLLRDGNDNDSYTPGRLLDSSVEPGDDFSSLVMPFFLRNRLWATFFNNDLGYSLLPEVRANAAYSYFYRVEYFADRVANKLAELRAHGKPFVLIVHSCALHWPGAFPFPYYPAAGAGEARWSRFAFTSRFTGAEEFSPIFEDLTARSKWLKLLYARGVKYITDRFLSPVTEELARQGFLDGAVTVLTSDHGEAFPGEGRDQPRFRFPQHGSTLLFGADSERAFLRIGVPGMRGRALPGLFSTMDILPTVAELLNVKTALTPDGTSFAPAMLKGRDSIARGAYSETGLWPLGGFSGQVFLNVQAFGSFYHISPDAHEVIVGEENEPAIIAVKQRAFIWDHFQFTLFPTSFGMQFFLCDLAADPECRRDASAADPAAVRKGLAELERIVAPDIKRGFFPALQWQPSLEGGIRHLPLLAPESGPMSLYLQGMEAIFRSRDYFGGARILDSLLGGKNVPPYLQGMATRMLFELCQFSAVPARGRKLHFYSLSDPELQDFGVPDAWVRDCPGAYGAAAAGRREQEKINRQPLEESPDNRNLVDFGAAGTERISSGERDLLSRRISEESVSQDPRFRLLWDGLVARKLDPDRFDASLAALQPDAQAYQLVQEQLVRFVARYDVAERRSESRLAARVACDLSVRPLPLWYRFLLDRWIDSHSSLEREQELTVANLRRALVEAGRATEAQVETLLDRYREAVVFVELKENGAAPQGCHWEAPSREWVALLRSPSSRRSFAAGLRHTNQ